MNRKPQHTCILSDGRVVRFSVYPRPGEPCYFVRFRSPEGRRLEKSTRKASQKAAIEEGSRLVREAYQPKAIFDNISWEDAIQKLKEACEAQNLRERSVGDYLQKIANLRTVFPSSQGPSDITPSLAQLFKTRRQQAGRDADTVFGDVNKLSCVWEKWFRRTLGIVQTNPWAEVEKPKLDEPEPRYIEPQEEQAFFEWFTKRWDGWKLPVLFFRLKGATGRRITQLCSLASSALQDGRVVFLSRTPGTKSRKVSYARIPDDLFQELQSVAGPTFLFERYSEQLNAIYRSRKQRRYARCGEYRPARLRRFLQDEVTCYNRENEGKPGFRKFTAHNFRDTAFTRAWDADVPLEKAAIAIDCNPATARKHYVFKNNVAIADEVFEKLSGRAKDQPKQGGQSEQAQPNGQ